MDLMTKKSKVYFAREVLSFLKEAKSQAHKLGFQRGYEYVNLRDAMFDLLLEYEKPLHVDTSRYNSKNNIKLKNKLAEGIMNIVRSKLNHEPLNLNNTKKVYSIAKILLSRNG